MESPDKRAATTTSLRSLFVCPECRSKLAWAEANATCSSCGRVVPIVRGIPRFVEASTHENFAIQWKRFWDVQLDSKNGTTESRDRLLFQSGMRPEDFAGKTVLEVGCGAGRFTEVLLSFGAKVIALDYSEAVDACTTTNDRARQEGQLTTGQADVFKLPFRETFDIVIGYGMLQHTGDPKRALTCLWERVKTGGTLLVDRYEVSPRRLMIFKYAARPITRRLAPQAVLSYCEKAVHTLFPLQRAVLQKLQGGGLAKKLARFAVNRSPTSVYPINLEVAGKLDLDTAFRWSVLDTFDQYAPAFDLPCTKGHWRRQLRSLPGGVVVSVGTGGQGNVGVVRRPTLAAV